MFTYILIHVDICVYRVMDFFFMDLYTYIYIYIYI